MSSKTCKMFWLLCLLANAFECWGNGEAHCDCKGLNEVVNVHTNQLSELVSYQRKTEGLITLQEKLTTLNSKEHNRDVTQKLEGIEHFIAELKIQTTKVEDELAEYRNITQKLDSWIQRSNTTIANVVNTTLQSTTYASDVKRKTTPTPAIVEARRAGPRRTPEQTIFEQVKLMVANLTTEMAVLRNYKLPRLESKVAAIEARLPVN
ncbi:uncharacterized protein LOC130689778 [Daphnia carinata]|uniref:uncharacterized protein LOC130689778 n=1 Tax=Daphnia carinata TaxID=120202 RepID=UPI00257D0E3B|nr:uncharacterized protein LOC130689778 [Daphnia carinata]